MNKKNIASEIFKIIIIFLLISSSILLNPIGDMDELWNYNFARNVSNGLLPYKDFNMVQMPLLPFICAIFLKLIANELIIMRILCAILCTTIIFLIYKIFNLLELDKRISFLFSIWILLQAKNVFFVDYNWATLLVVLILIYSELKFLKKNKYEQLVSNFKFDFVIGILSGLTILLKQTTGLAICMVALGYKLLIVTNKEDFKRYLKVLGYRILGQALIVFLFIIYLLISNSLNDWFDYTILGIKYFNNKIQYNNLFKNDNYIIKILSILVPINFIYLYIKLIFFDKQKKNEEKNLFILFVYSLSTFILVYPIADTVHFLIASMISIMLILYIIYDLFRKLKLDDKSFKIKEFVVYMVFVVVVIYSIFHSLENIYKYFKLDYKSELAHYSNISIDKSSEEEIKNVDDYILEQEELGRKTYILDAYACIYMIPINKYNKDYDMLLKGNLGNNETEKLINNLNSQNNINILVRNKGSLNWQTPVNILDYFKENLDSIRRSGVL